MPTPVDEPGGDRHPAMDHPDDMPPSKELKDIALQAAGAAAKAERGREDAEREKVELGSLVGTLKDEVSGLREEVSTAVKQEDLRRSERHTLRVFLVPMIIGALAVVVIAAGTIALLHISGQNGKNGELIINCTTPPSAHPSPQELKEKACYVRGQSGQADAIRQLNCVTLLVHAIPAPPCEDVRKQYVDAGVKLPPPAPPG